MNADALRRRLERDIRGEVRFDRVSRALYATDASVYQIEPIGVVVPRTREDLVRVVEHCRDLRCPITMRGAGTSQAGQAIGAGVVVDTSKYLHHVLELDADARRVRVEPGIVLDHLNAVLRPHGLRFAPDISTASRATVGGMMANNSSGARSVLYGKTIDHVVAQDVILSDGSLVEFRDMPAVEAAARADANGTLESACYRVVRHEAMTLADEIDRRFPKVIRRVGGYNLDAFTSPDRPFNLAKLMVGSEGTLGVVTAATLSLVPLPRSKGVLVVQFADLLESLAATPVILRHGPSAVEVMDAFILDHTHKSPALEHIRRGFIEGDPAALLCIEMHGDDDVEVREKLHLIERDLAGGGMGYRYRHVLDPAEQARVWTLREAALGLSMAMKDAAKSLSFVEDTAVQPERLRDYIERFQSLIARHGTSAGIYAHASVGCLHVRPVINLKTADGVRTFAALAADVAALVLEFGGALSGEHGDGLVRSPFMEKMFGSVLYQAFRRIKGTFDPDGIFNPGKIVDAAPITEHLRYGPNYRTSAPETHFDYSAYGGIAGAVEMCSGLGACRKTMDGTMCPSFVATREEADSTRGRANVLRLAMSGRLGESGLGDDGVYRVLDLCLECRACKSECPVGVDVARFKSEFLADYWRRHGVSRHAKVMGGAHALAKWGSRFAPLSNWIVRRPAVRRLNERLLGIDARRPLPTFAGTPLRARTPASAPTGTLLFVDTFTNYYDPEIGSAALDVLAAAGLPAALAPNVCCGRPKISKGLLADARTLADRNVQALYPHAEAGRTIVFCEPSCLSALREDVPSLLRGDRQRQAGVVAEACRLFEDVVEGAGDRLALLPGPPHILLHGHCHQRSMGFVRPAAALLARIPGARVVDLDAGCCGMAGSFGYARDHFDVSRRIAEGRLLPAIRTKPPGAVIVAAGTSCRHQVKDFAGETAVHPAVLLQSVLRKPGFLDDHGNPVSSSASSFDDHGNPVSSSAP